MMISKLSNISDSDTGIVLDKAKCLNVITDTDYAEIEEQVTFTLANSRMSLINGFVSLFPQERRISYCLTH